MKTKLDLRIIILFGLLLIMGVRIASGQDAQHRFLGIGIRSSVFQISDLQNVVIPSNKLIIGVDPLKYVRAELHGSFYRKKWDEPIPAYPVGYRTFAFMETSYLMGGGIFGIYPVDQAKFLLGVRFSKNYYSDTELGYSDFIQDYTVNTNKGEASIMAGILGGEYIFSKWFSVGAEFSVIRLTDTYRPVESAKIDSQTLITETSLVFRFYPF